MSFPIKSKSGCLDSVIGSVWSLHLVAKGAADQESSLLGSRRKKVFMPNIS